MFHASTEKDGRGTHKARDGDLVTSPNPYASPSPNGICYIYSSCADKRGHYPSKCVVEQIDHEYESKREASSAARLHSREREGPGQGCSCVAIKFWCCQEMKGEYLSKLNTET